MRRASIDIGSNSVLLLAVEMDDGGHFIKKELLNESFITSLGKDLDATKKFHPDSMQATYEALKKYKELLDDISFPVEKVMATATEASRVSTNSREFFKKIKDELGFTIQIISSDGEAYYTALGVVSSMQNVEDKVIVMDIGGASTELIHIQTAPFQIVKSVSLPVGSVRATDWKKQGEFEKKMNDILSADLSHYETHTLVCVAGSMTALTAMYIGLRTYTDVLIDRVTIPFEEFQGFVTDLQERKVEDISGQYRFLGKRAPMVQAGALVADLIGSRLKVTDIYISSRGLRYGTVITGGIDGQFINE